MDHVAYAAANDAIANTAGITDADYEYSDDYNSSDFNESIDCRFSDTDRIFIRWNAMDYVPILPTEILCKVFNYCNVVNLVSWNLVCRDWRVISTHCIHKRLMDPNANHALTERYVMWRSLDTEIEDWRSKILRNGVFAQINTLSHSLFEEHRYIRDLEIEEFDRYIYVTDYTDDTELINFDD